jgi:hypothetical protein
MLAMAVRPATPQPQRVWFSFANSGVGPLLLEIKLDGLPLYNSTIPICHASRESAESRAERRGISFPLQPRRAIKLKVN